MEVYDDEMMRQQEELLMFFNKNKNSTQKSKILDEDEALAKLIQEEEYEAEKKRLLSSSKTKSDAEYAQFLVNQEKEEQERQRRIAEEDERLARKLMEEEDRKQKQEQEKKEWSNTLELIRSEAKQEADAELARVLREKEELELRMQELANANFNSGFVTLDSVEHPLYWAPQISNQQTFDVKADSDEWKTIQARFHVPIHRIERNQNKNLWMWYFLKKMTLQEKNTNGRGANEKVVFHGSRNNAYEIILRDGFDARVANMGGAIGAGIYFAEQSQTSMSYVGQNRKMLLCRVCVGSVGKGVAGIRRPPATGKKINGNIEELFDSVGNEGSVYVVFDNHVAYPEYVIHF